MDFANELTVDTLDYEEVTNEQGDQILQFRTRLIGKAVEATSGLNLTKMDALLTNWDNRSLTWEQVMKVGDELGKALFREPLRQVLLQNLPRPGDDQGLRLRLLLQYPLTNYPFEYILINDTGGETTANHFLGLRPNLSIVRQQANQAPPAARKPAAFPVKMVAALASPAMIQPVLDLSQERSAIEKAVDPYPDRIQTAFCQPATLTNLGQALQDAPIFHYAGHATMPRQASKVFGLLEGKGKLILENEDGDGLPAPLEIEQLSSLLKTANTRLAFLGGCETARRDDLNLWSSLAAHLLNAGLFAVLGMQYKIGNSNATRFAAEFYNALLAGLSIDQAVVNGRLAIAAAGDARDWGVPVLYLAGASDGLVFEEFKDSPALEPVRQQVRAKAHQTAEQVNKRMTGIKAREINWGKAEVYQNIKLVGKDAVVIGIDAERVGPGADLDMKGEYGQVDGDVYGMVIGTIGDDWTPDEIDSDEFDLPKGLTGGTQVTISADEVKNAAQVIGQMTGNTYKGDHVDIENLIFYQGPQPTLTGDTTPEEPLIEETIRLDVALPESTQLGEPFDLAVAVRQPEAPPLAIEDLTAVASSEGQIFRTEEDQVVQYRVEVSGSGCSVLPKFYIIKLRPKTNSRTYYFQVTPERPGKRSLFITAYQEDDALAAQTRIVIEVAVPVIPDNEVEPARPAGVCPKCGTRNDPGSKFCQECGQRLITD